MKNHSIVLIIFLCFILVTNNYNLTSNNNDNESALKIVNRNNKNLLINSKSILLNINKSPIKIVNNSGFLLYGFSGNGTSENPYLIENYVIRNGSSTLISISNTNLSFIVQNNILDGITGDYDGIYLNNVINGQIINNSISNCFTGIFLNLAQNNNLFKNKIENCLRYGIKFSNSDQNYISSNEVYFTYYGCYLDSFSSENSIINNSISDNLNSGIYIRGISSLSVISGNIINNNSIHGISIHHGCVATKIINNNITNNEVGIFLAGTPSNNISANFIFFNQYGIQILESTFYTLITKNLFFENYEYGLFLGNEVSMEPVEYSIIMWNNFINNNLEGTSQAFDQLRVDGLESKNTYIFNYWNEWSSPDINLDGIVDYPYIIDGSNIQDLYPLSDRSSFSTHILSKPKIYIPYFNDEYEDITIKWKPAIDSFGYSVSYSLYISSNNGNTWMEIIADSFELSYHWNASLFEFGCYRLKIVATSEGGLSTEALTGNFPLKMDHILSSPQFISPINENSLSNIVTIQWTPAIDNCFYLITYNVSYSADGGSTWTLLTSEQNITSFSWNTSTVDNGDNFKIKIVAISSGGLVNSTISNDTFTIYNKLSNPSSENFPFLEITIFLFIFSELAILLILLKFIRKKKIQIDD